VGDEHDRLLGVEMQSQQLILQQPPRLCVYGSERLVHQQDARIDGERARETDPLLHAAGQLSRKMLFESFEPDGLDQPARDLLALRLAHATQLEAKRDARQHVGPRQQRRLLKDDRPFGTRTGDARSVDQHLAGVGSDQSRQDPQQRRLPTAARADDADQLVRGDVEREIVERGRRGGAVFGRKRLANPSDADHSVATRPAHGASRRSAYRSRRSSRTASTTRKRITEYTAPESNSP
jgi:hypothetical protein